MSKEAILSRPSSFSASEPNHSSSITPKAVRVSTPPRAKYSAEDSEYMRGSSSTRSTPHCTATLALVNLSYTEQPPLCT